MIHPRMHISLMPLLPHNTAIIREVMMSDYHGRKKQRTDSPEENSTPSQGSVMSNDTGEHQINVFQLSRHMKDSSAPLNLEIDSSYHMPMMKEPIILPDNMRLLQHEQDNQTQVPVIEQHFNQCLVVPTRSSVKIMK